MLKVRLGGFLHVGKKTRPEGASVDGPAARAVSLVSVGGVFWTPGIINEHPGLPKTANGRVRAEQQIEQRRSTVSTSSNVEDFRHHS